jgi:hypothetical protein
VLLDSKYIAGYYVLEAQTRLSCMSQESPTNAASWTSITHSETQFLAETLLSPLVEEEPASSDVPQHQVLLGVARPPSAELLFGWVMHGDVGCHVLKIQRTDVPHVY